MAAKSRVSRQGLTQAARIAGSRIMEWYARRGDIIAQAKSDHSPVTQADLAAHDVLMEELPRLLPGIPVVSEENAGDAAATLKLVAETPCFWLIDPLDGTRDFLARSGDFSVNIALMVDGEPVVGCVFAPVHNACYVAERGEGAFQQLQAGGAMVPIRTRPSDRERFVCLVSRSHHAGETELLHSAFPQAVVRAVGSALKYAQIAAGLADIAVRKSPTSLWDTAAAQCVLEAAGGLLVDFAGKPIGYRTGTLTNPPFVAVGDPTMPWQMTLKDLRLA